MSASLQHSPAKSHKTSLPAPIKTSPIALRTAPAPATTSAAVADALLLDVSAHSSAPSSLRERYAAPHDSSIEPTSSSLFEATADQSNSCRSSRGSFASDTASTATHDSALAALRSRLADDAQARKEIAEGHHKKLKKRRPKSAQSHKERHFDGDSIATSTEFSGDESHLDPRRFQDESQFGGEVLTDSSPEIRQSSFSTRWASYPPTLSRNPSSRPASSRRSSSKHSTGQRKSPGGSTQLGPLDQALALPPLALALVGNSVRLGVHTTGAAVRLPFRVASHVPLLGRLIPRSEGPSTLPPLIRETLEMATGLVLATLFLALATAQFAMRSVTGRRYKQSLAQSQQ